MGGGGGLGRHQSRSCRGSQSSLRPHPCTEVSWLSTGADGWWRRSWHSRTHHPWAPSMVTCCQASQAHRQPLVGVVHQQTVRHRFIGREEEAWRQEGQLREPAWTATESRPKRQGQEQRQRKGKRAARRATTSGKSLDESVHVTTADEGPKNTDRRVPGSYATTVAPSQLWNSMIRWLLRSKAGTLRSFFHSSLKRTYEDNQPDAFRPVWPIPLPFDDSRGQFHFGILHHEIRQALTAMVITLNWLHLGQPSRLPQEFCSRGPLSGAQRAVVQRLLRLTTAWQKSPPITAADIGRTAAKVENVEMSIAALTAAAHIALRQMGSGKTMLEQELPRSDKAKESVFGEIQVAKNIESHRVKFSGSPTFDPSPLLDPQSQLLYDRPLEAAEPPTLEGAATWASVRARGF